MGTRRKFRLCLSETIQPRQYNSLRVEWDEGIEFDESALPKGVTLDDARKAFISHVRVEFAKRRTQAIQDFIDANGG